MGAVIEDLPELSTEQTAESTSLKTGDPAQWIRQLPGNPSGNTGQKPEDSGNNSEESASSSGSPGKEQPTGNNPQQADQGSPDQEEPQAADSTAETDASRNRTLTITFIGQSNSGKSSLANCLLGIQDTSESNVLETVLMSLTLKYYQTFTYVPCKAITVTISQAAAFPINKTMTSGLTGMKS